MKFSIILPTYNRAHQISTAIESVMAQSFKDWELIVIDDGSDDNTKEIVENFTNLNDKVKYYWQENKERSAARNNGISKAKGEFIVFLDSDDFFGESHLNSISDAIETSDKEIGFFFIDFKNKIGGELLTEEIAFYDGNSSFLAYLFTNPIGTPRGIVRRELLVNNPFDEEIIIGEDMELWCRVSQNTLIKHLRIDSYIINNHEGRSIVSDGLKARLAHIETVRKIRGFAISTEEKQKGKDQLSYSYFKLGVHYQKYNNKIKAVLAFLRGLFISPFFRPKNSLYEIYKTVFK